MGRKKTGAVPTAQPKEKQKMVIDMTKVELAKAYHVPGFRTGRHMTDKDRPRKRNWKKEYERSKKSDPYGNYGCDFLLCKRQEVALPSVLCLWKLQDLSQSKVIT